MNGYTNSGMYATPASDHRRGRGSFGFPAGQRVGPSHMIMTPDPTVGSAVSEEDKDVAIQLMRMSNHGRASASTQDDTFSGRADAASSTGATSDAESCSGDDGPAARKQKLDASGAHNKVFNAPETPLVYTKDSAEVATEDVELLDHVENGTMAAPPAKVQKTKTNTLVLAPPLPPAHKIKPAKAAKPKPKTASVAGPMTPASLPGSRKQSVLSNPALPSGAGEEEPDLSTQPRCQRCRKSKKGCDRQRPCGRCRDAGLPAELCISEDEGNGRKGRYGRHMGVPVKKETQLDATMEDMPPPAPNLLPAAPIAPIALALVTSLSGVVDKTKKRKR